jgi:hypothetical protein
LSHELALRFASKCYTHLEIAHYKDTFKTLADHEEDVEYWKEDTLCRFLAIPESLQTGPVVYHMCTYLGAFPFPSLAPCILTREAMLKIVTIMTGRFKRVLKRGDQDKVKLLFRSLAVFDRKASLSSPKETTMEDVINEQLPEDMLKEREAERGLHPSGFAIDESANDGDEDEDDDDLALAALDSLDAIEVFRHDHRTDRKINHAMIPAADLRRLVMLLLLVAGIEPLTPVASYAEELDQERLQALDASARAIVAAFDPEPSSDGIRYSNFVKTMTATLPELFEPFSPLFEHFLFSKNINLNKHRNTPTPTTTPTPKPSPIYQSPDDDSPSTLTDTLLSQISMSLKLYSPSGSLSNIYTSNAKFNRLYSSSNDGTSLNSFSRQVMSWNSATLVLVSGSISDAANTPIMLGAYLPERWHGGGSSSKPTTSLDPSTPKACLFQLQPRQAVFPANPYNRAIPWSYFSNKTGIALGCVIPQQSRAASAAPQPPILGPVGLLVDVDMSTATFQHDGGAGTGAFVTDASLETAQAHHPQTTQPKKCHFEVDNLEVWGISFPTTTGGEEDELTKQKQRLAWEEAEAARRRGVNFGGDKDGARALLEMAGLVGDKASSRSGGSV